jgi:hypothetical protein
VSEARRNWLPQGDLLSILAPSPEPPLLPASPHPRADSARYAPRPENCVRTANNEVRLSNVSWNRDLHAHRAQARPARVGLRQDLGRRRGRPGGPSEWRTSARNAARADVEQNVRKAYWGMKLARDVPRHARHGLGLRRRGPVEAREGSREGHRHGQRHGQAAHPDGARRGRRARPRGQSAARAWRATALRVLPRTDRSGGHRRRRRGVRAPRDQRIGP